MSKPQRKSISASPPRPDADEPWSKDEAQRLRELASPEKVQALLDSLPYRCEDAFPPPTHVLRDGRAHCFDGALLAASALLRSDKYEPLLVNLRAVRDDDHLLCVYRIRNGWGAIAKSNFPALRWREPVYRSVRELVMSYFDCYCNLQKERTLRAFSTPFGGLRSRSQEWEWRQQAVDKLGDRLSSRRHIPLLRGTQAASLSLLDDRSFKAQTFGVNRQGAYKGG